MSLSDLSAGHDLFQAPVLRSADMKWAARFKGGHGMTWIMDDNGFHALHTRLHVDQSNTGRVEMERKRMFHLPSGDYIWERLGKYHAINGKTHNCYGPMAIFNSSNK